MELWSKGISGGVRGPNTPNPTHPFHHTLLELTTPVVTLEFR